MDHSQALETIEWHEEQRDKLLKENAALKAKLAMVEKARGSWWLNHRNDWDFNWILKTALTTEPKVLAVVDAWRLNDEDPADVEFLFAWANDETVYSPVTVIILAREGVEE